ncbi:uncharacterized protein LOC116607810 [Nematostella vectensis]|uniref:uncharacterized protein LOC116607810 n=1 Tax=Nematostella vectensis TaxID=45351 RepID=UPI0020771A74|nr:uncharacterized protein LOC116607810 [Nematostella vectensis]
MSARSCPAGLGARSRRYNTRRNRGEDMEERIVSLKRSRSGCLGSLRRFRKEIEELMYKGNRNEVSRKLQSYHNTWVKFVRVHSDLMDLMDEGEEKMEAQRVYDMELTLKLELYSAVDEQDIESGSQVSERHTKSRVSDRESRSHVSSRHSSRYSRSSVKSVAALEERAALSKLDLGHLRKKQQLNRKFDELKYAHELLEAEVKCEKAQTSYMIF